MQKIILILAFLLTAVSVSRAEDVNFTASAPAEVAVGERFRLTFQVNKRPSEFNAPDFSGFRVLSGPSQSSSTSMQIINGQTTRTESFSYSYVLEAQEEGRFTIQPASITYEGQNYRSNSVNVRVSAATSSAPGTATQPGTTTPSQPGQADARDIFIRATASTTQPFQGEQVIVSYNLYTRVSVNQYSIDKLPSYRGFWSETLSAPSQPQTRTEVIDGETYRVAEIRKVALFPQRSGQISIEPMEMDVVVSLPGQRRRQSLFDEFFGGSPFDQRSVRQTLKSNTLTLNVKPLPVQNRPAAFSGMVGSDFTIQATVTPQELQPNDAANLKVSISGRGNIRMLEKPAFQFPANLEVFDPNVIDDIRNTAAGVGGSRSFDYVMIPRTGGEFVIPPFSFVYFDPQRQQYITRETPEFVLTAEGDAGSPGVAAREDIRTLARDIRHIHTNPIALVPKGMGFYGSKLFYVFLLSPFALFLFFIIYWREQIRLQSNQQLLRNRKAEKMARKRLKTARKFLQNKQETEFYDEIFRALWGYLSDKLSIPVSILNKETVHGAFKSQKVSEELSHNFLSALDECEFARFAPGPKEDKMADIYQKALETIVTIEKDLRSKKQ